MTTRTDRDLGFVTDLNSRYLQCRTIRHQFELTYFGPASGLKDFTSKFVGAIVIRQAKCRRCGILKEDFFNAPNANRAAMGLKFTAFHRRYRYPAGYTWSKAESGGEKPTAGDYNLELYTRTNAEEQ